MTDTSSTQPITTVRSARFAVRRARKVVAQPWFGVSSATTRKPVEIGRIEALTRLNFYDEHVSPAEAKMPNPYFALVVGTTVYLG